ncbi:MAG: SgcJ/EcaC family oxidoreductase [Vicinamibacterales bacterium]
MKAVRTDRKDFIAYPTNRVVGTIGDAEKARAAVDALLQRGFEAADIETLHGEDDLKRLDPTGSEHGHLAQLQRALIRSLDLEEFKHLAHRVEDVRAGRFVIMVLIRRRAQRLVAADVLHEYGAEFVGFFGRWACVGLPATAQRSPADIPPLFARAWNDRNPDALAALFDEDAEYITGAGVRWPDREAIRTAHAHDTSDTSRLEVDEIKVKLLSPDIAVVHTRMNVSGQPAADVTTELRPRSAIVSFVVHHAIDRWQCASAHRTDVVPTSAAAAVERAGTVGVPSYPSGQST